MVTRRVLSEKRVNPPNSNQSSSRPVSRGKLRPERKRPAPPWAALVVGLFALLASYEFFGATLLEDTPGFDVDVATPQVSTYRATRKANTIPRNMAALPRYIVADTLHKVTRLSVPRNHSSFYTGDESWRNDFEDEYDDFGYCFPMHKWQLSRYGPSSCNLLHELDMTAANNDLEMINCGGERCAFRIDDRTGNEAVLKITQMYDDGYSTNCHHRAWKDTIAMERTTSSPYTSDIYGNCGVSQLTELSRGGTIHDLMKISRRNGEKMTAQDRLRVGYHVAAGLAALHSFDGAPSIAHNDICCHQYILIDGVYKLNDFHQASVLTLKEDGSPCKQFPFRQNVKFVKLRPPEEARWRRKSNMRGEKVHKERSDVWMMGDILYYVLTKQWLFEGKLNVEAIDLLSAGKRSEIPPHILNSSDPADQAMLRAIEMAWVQDPTERPPAQEIATFLEEQLIKINGNVSDAPWRVTIPPLPPGYRFTNSDYRSNYRDDP